MRASGNFAASAPGTKPANAGSTGVMPNARMRAKILRCSSAGQFGYKRDDMRAACMR